MKTIVAIIGLAALSGCATPNAPASNACPPVAPYTKSFEAQWGAELAKLPETDPLAIVSRDYIKLRDLSRACAGK